MSSITGANAVVMLAITGLFPVPLQLQGFAADDVFDTEAIESAEVLMGVDRKMSAGFVAVPVKQTYTLQADSASMFFFDTWWAAQQVIGDLYFASGIAVLNAVNQKWIMTKGALTSFKPTPDVKKLLQPRKFTVTWESVLPAAA